uniref:Genome polyprotein n=1 Tax=Catharanthus mosaic virus TaxID=369752 RepID=A0A5C1IRT4_9POTV|nr:polyprotein [Catharanthus mosaic virus]
MATMFFGQFEVTVPKTFSTETCKKIAQPVHTNPIDFKHKILIEQSRMYVRQYEESINKAFSEVQTRHTNDAIHVVKKKRGLMCYRPKTQNELEKEERERIALEKFEAYFNKGRIIDTIEVDHNEEGPHEWQPLEPMKKVFTHRAIKKKTQKPVIKGDTFFINKLVRATANLVRIRPSLKVEIIGKKSMKAQTGMILGRRCLRFECLHMKGIKRRVDISVDKTVFPYLEIFAEKFHKSPLDVDQLMRGSSGTLLLTKHMRGNFISRLPFFIIRGRHSGRLVSALAKQSYWTTLEMTHYSIADEFWRGFDASFLDHRGEKPSHECQRDIPVQEAGELAALLNLSIQQTWKITCRKCFADILSNVETMKAQYFINSINRILPIVRNKGHGYQHITKLFESVLDMMPQHSTALHEQQEVMKIVGHKTEAPWSHLMTVNNVLIKGGSAKTDELNKAQQALLEITRWFNKRTEMIQAGSLQSFRNKMTGKTQINLALMCDNQLDANGNFLWGKRGYHAKRIFANYFEPIDSSNGYVKHSVRKSKNTTRKLAISNLIVPLDLERARSHLSGESITPVHQTSESCVTRKGRDFHYPTCCVTTDSGDALLSPILNPTKRHLVVGNTGDSKIVDLPEVESESLYIAKEGYCYLNIFLAMLVNVNENDAKDFTKKVRDVIVPMLKEWPTMEDLASACYLLSVFFPETRSAELPRILVDHSGKTFHVMDSFGSLNTGYHILKASTVSQLISFASNDITGEMKHYNVGGFRYNSEVHIVHTLIKSMYNPELMKEVLTEEPYLLLGALMSPAVLIEMERNKHFDTCIDLWVSKDMSVSATVSILKKLTGKVSKTRSLLEQLTLMQMEADKLLHTMCDGFKLSHSYMPMYLMLNSMKQNVEANRELVNDGFMVKFDGVDELIEKNYEQELQRVWREQRFCGKLRYFISRGKSQIASLFSGEEEIARDTTQALRKSSSIVVSQTVSAMGSVSSKFKQFVHNRMQSVNNFLINSIVNIFSRFVSAYIKYANTIMVLLILAQFTRVAKELLVVHKRGKMYDILLEEQEHERELDELYVRFVQEHKNIPTHDEFVQLVIADKPHLIHLITPQKHSELVKHQSKGENTNNLEKYMAVAALVALVFDSARGDAVYRILTKIKTLTSVASQDVYHQSTDDYMNLLLEKEHTIDITLDTNGMHSTKTFDTTFEQWWNAQLREQRVVPHYRFGGKFIEFTRETVQVAVAQINNEVDVHEFLIRGNVGSGKSTGLPHALSKKGHILVLEPTRPLAENVCKQLRKEPFFSNPTLRMKGMSAIGSSPITIMTTGYALHFFAHNRTQLADFAYIMFDECHVLDASGMAFFCLLSDSQYTGKVLKVSATPPGRECDFKTQHPVSVNIEDTLSFEQFVNNQGTNCNSDVVSKGDNILVYVASYNEVDRLTNLLTHKNYKVTKIDGRTMKLGSVDIQTVGTKDKKHFLVATNIVENGVTLDVDVVVDFGIKVEPVLDMDNRMICYRKVNISFGERVQRLGRVGRFKRGHALRIGSTEKHASEIPSMLATEAAFLSFAYGLPVMTHSVIVSALDTCTVKQARTMLHFELSPFFMKEMVAVDGTMHPEVHRLLIPYKLRDSEIVLITRSIPCSAVSRWLTAKDYRRLGAMNECEDSIRIPFFVKGCSERFYTSIWDTCCKFKKDAGFGSLSSASVSKIAYTLQTDILSIERTVKIIDKLIESETIKHATFKHNTSDILCNGSFTLMGIANAIKGKYMVDHSLHNINTLHAARAQLLEFKSLNVDPNMPELLNTFGVLDLVQHQSEEEISKALRLKGRWNKSLLSKDIIVLLCVLGGGVFMIYDSFKSEASNSDVHHEGKSKRTRQKLKFRNARDAKMGREVFGDDGALEYNFGSAYEAKKKKGSKGTVKGMGAKKHKFYHVYGFDPTDYSTVRFVDPLTGATLDENPYADMSLVQEHFDLIRHRKLIEDELDAQHLYSQPGIIAYYLNNASKTALKVDLTPHNPLLVTKRTNSISGFPERAGELRQTGEAQIISFEQVPKDTSVLHEGASMVPGVRDYNPISNAVCKLINESDGHKRTLYGIGYGHFIITNRHLFEHNNGKVTVKSKHGEFLIPNSTSLMLLPVPDRDILVIKLPKDFPPFPQKIQFAAPEEGMTVTMVGALFQERSQTPLISPTCTTFRKDESHFWKHWISTKDGQCGTPFVEVKTSAIVGLHSLGSCNSKTNYFVGFPQKFVEEFIIKENTESWRKCWRYNPDQINWGSMNVKRNMPTGLFKISKIPYDLNLEEVVEQGSTTNWLTPHLISNLEPVMNLDGQLVTKHNVKGECPLFQIYLSTHPEAKLFFQPLMQEYGPSVLSKESFIKDFTKYAGPIVVGTVNHEAFEQGFQQLIHKMEQIGFTKCNYILDTETIMSSLNMKAAVGALYQGKKKEYIEQLTDEERDQLIRDSCFRLFTGRMGIWNGSLKAELRPVEKIRACKTRTFTAAPIDTLLGGKVCVDDFNEKFYSFNIRAPWTVGMTKFYRGWDQLVRSLPEGWIYCDADGSRFDSSLSPFLLNAVLRLRLHFMEEWDIGEEMLSNLYTEIIYTPIAVPAGLIVKKFKGNNSGQPSTVVDNSLMVCMMMEYSKAKFQQFSMTEDNVRYYCNGDDLVIAVRPDSVSFLDSLQSSFKELGLDYDFSHRTENVEELWFMSHKAQLREGVYIPKLEQERIVSILQWDRSTEPTHRLEAICASMIEAWGYDELLHEIRKFYAWILEQQPYATLASEGKAPYIAETALRHLYCGETIKVGDIEIYLREIVKEHNRMFEENLDDSVYHQSGETKTVDAGGDKQPEKPKEKDVDAGSSGKMVLPKLKKMSSKMRMPTINGRNIINVDHIIQYEPNQVDIANTRATKLQFENWYYRVKNEYDVDDQQMSILMNGLMVWCIENGTSPNINGMWTMMEGDNQEEYPLKPIIENAKPTFRQIMAHFSDAAEAYIEMRNSKEPYMPRYGLQRNLTDMSLARYAFDFYEVTSRTPNRAREAHMQMKAAALRNASFRLFGLDGNVSAEKEDTERHTTDDVNRAMHNMLGVRTL